MAKQIDEKTLIPLSVLAVLAGGIFWLSSIYFQGQANAESAESNTQAIANERDERRAGQKEVMDRLNMMDLKLDRLLRR